VDSIKIITTEDGSHSLLNETLDETYHSRHGARQESEYVFINKGLDFFLKQNPTKSVSILEIGFGTGLNALLTAQKSIADLISVNYTTLETHPVPSDIWKTLNYSLNDLVFEDIHNASWNEWITIHPTFKLFKNQISLQQVVFSVKQFDVIFFDAFAPNKQPEMWTYEMLEKIYQAMNPNGIFVTYCAKGQLKRDLKSLGMRVESLPGPPGKREMVRAIKL